MTPRDPSLTLPDPVPLAEPLGSLAHELSAPVSTADDAPVAVAGRRARVMGGAARGVDEVRVGPLRIADGPRALGAVAESATITPLGLERRLRVGDAGVIERVVVPRDAQLALFEWAAAEDAVAMIIEWIAGLALDGAHHDADPGPLRWRKSAAAVVVGRDACRAVFVVGGGAGLSAEDVPDDPARVRIRARVQIPAGGSVRIAMAGGTGEGDAARALGSARHAGSAVGARRGIADRLRRDRLAVNAPDPALGHGVEWAKVRLAGAVPAGAPDSPAVSIDALDCLLLGDFPAGLETLRCLGRHEGVGGAGMDPIHYLRLAAEYLAWTGDIVSVQTEWPRLAAAWRDAEGGGHGALDGELRTGLVHLAEAVGDTTAAAGLRAAADRNRGREPSGSDDPEHGPHDLAGRPDAPPLDRVRALLGVRPDASQGRLVLRPRPPADWDRFDVSSLAVGDAAVSLSYRRDANAHRFEIQQVRGASPIRCILEPELPGRLRAARVDGVEARLEPARVGARTRVPVQLALDHERILELEMED